MIKCEEQKTYKYIFLRLFDDEFLKKSPFSLRKNEILTKNLKNGEDKPEINTVDVFSTNNDNTGLSLCTIFHLLFFNKFFLD